MNKPLLLSFLLLFVASCTQTRPDICFLPEQDMYREWEWNCYQPMEQNIEYLLSIDEYLTQGDTLSARQQMARLGWVIDGTNVSLSSQGATWTVYGTSDTGAIFVITTPSPDSLRYTVPRSAKSDYHYDENTYGTNSYYTITFSRGEGHSLIGSGSGYINTDGSVDMTFDVQSVRIYDTQAGTLTLSAYAHRYDTTVIYHYTFYDYCVKCNETGQEVSSYYYYPD